jgi:hypothetical protein
MARHTVEAFQKMDGEKRAKQAERKAQAAARRAERWRNEERVMAIVRKGLGI